MMYKNYSELLNDIEPDAVLSESHNFYQTVFLCEQYSYRAETL
jgi:hypothetical protein